MTTYITPRKKRLDDITRNYHRGNPESEAANESVHHLKDIVRAQVVAHVRSQRYRGATSDEVEVALDMLHQTVSARFTEAKKLGELVPNKEKRYTRSGRRAAVLVAPEYLEDY